MEKTFKQTVDELLGFETPEDDFRRAEGYAKRKLQLAKEREPDAAHYNEYYRALLTRDVYNELMFSRYTMERSAAIMAEREEAKNCNIQ